MRHSVLKNTFQRPDGAFAVGRLRQMCCRWCYPPRFFALLTSPKSSQMRLSDQIPLEAQRPYTTMPSKFVNANSQKMAQNKFSFLAKSHSSRVHKEKRTHAAPPPQQTNEEARRHPEHQESIFNATGWQLTRRRAAVQNTA